MAGQPLSARPVGRGWPRQADPRSCPGHPLALAKPARRSSGRTFGCLHIGDANLLMQQLVYASNLGCWLPLAGIFYDCRHGGPRNTVYVG